MTHSPVYNARIHHMLRRRLVSFCVVSSLAVILHATAYAQNDWRTLEPQLARKIVTATGPGAVAVDVINRSSLSTSQADEARRGILAALGSLGLNFVSSDRAAATVQVTLSENLQSYVWVAEIHQGNDETSIVMAAVARPASESNARSMTPLTIQKTLLWSDARPILDVALPNNQTMIVLEPESAILLALRTERWEQLQSLSTQHTRPRPRDIRGRLVLRKDHLFDAYLPGVFCQSTNSAPLSLNCRDSDDPWPLLGDAFLQRAFFASSRNFFTGVLTPGLQKQTTTSPFYSAAPLPREKYTLWILTSVDGQIHMLDGVTDQVSSRPNWGSNIASVHSSCGAGWQLLVDSRGDTSADTITAVEIADREPVTVSPPLEFAGNISALWTAADNASAIAVAHNSQTEEYEAYRLLITCSQ